MIYLEENDILFIDSSHVAKMGDVNYLLFEILPRLKKGIFIHFHDMLWQRYVKKMDEKLKGCGEGSLWIKKYRVHN